MSIPGVINRIVLAAIALVVASNLAFLSPASAEFFGCNDQKKSTRVSVYAPAKAYARAGGTHEFAAQARPRIDVYPRERRSLRGAKRQCRAWLEKEYRVSGTVVVPRQQCWWQ